MRRDTTEIGLVERSRIATRDTSGATEGATRASLSNARPRGNANRRGYPCGAPPCRIYQPSPSVMQSGGRNRRGWVLEFPPRSPRWIEPLMGWTASEDPFALIRLRFPSLESAVEYAERRGLDYEVVDPPARRSGRRQNSNVSPEPERPGGQAHLAAPAHHDWLELMMMQR